MMNCCINNASGGLNSLLPWRPLCLAELCSLKTATTRLVVSQMGGFAFFFFNCLQVKAEIQL